MNKATCLTLQKLIVPAATTATLSYFYYQHGIPVAHAKQQQQQQTSFYSPEHNNNGNGNNNHSKNASLQQQQRTLGGSASSILSTNNNSNATRPPVYDNNNELYDDMIDLTKVREAIRKAIEDDMEKRGDGTSLYGTFLFLSWICAATYDDHAYAYYHHSCPFNAGKQKKKKNINSQLLLLPAVGGTHGAPARLRLLDAEKSAYFNNNSNSSSSSSSNVQYYQYRATSGAWKVARDALEPVKAKFPKLSYADLYAYAGVVAVEESGGPRIAFRLGRVDNDYCNINGDLNSAPSSPLHQQQQYQQHQQQQLSPQQQPSLVERLPEADKGSHVAMIRHIRQVFYRMGFNDQEIVALCGAHTLGRCHTTRSGYWGPFTPFENAFDNDYFRLLMLQQEQQEYWTRKLTHNGKPWMGPDQYEDTGNAAALANHHHHHTGNGGGNKNSGNSNASSNSSYGGSGGGGQLCRLPSDMVLLYDPEFKKWVELYARDRNRYFDDFSKAFAKLLELGVPFPPPPRPWWKRWFWFFW